MSRSVLISLGEEALNSILRLNLRRHGLGIGRDLRPGAGRGRRIAIGAQGGEVSEQCPEGVRCVPETATGKHAAVTEKLGRCPQVA